MGTMPANDAEPIDLTDNAQLSVIEDDCIAQLAGWGEGSVDVAVTSPPYNLGIRYNAYDDGITRERYLAWMGEVAAALARVLGERGQLFLNVGASARDPMVPYQVLAVMAEHFVLQNNILWVKSLHIDSIEKTFGHFKPINSPRYLNTNFEHVFHLTAKGAAKLDRLAIGVPFEHASNTRRWAHGRDRRCRGNVWHIPYRTVQSRAKQRGGHPATFPSELAERCIRLAGGRDPVVLDPFVGTGSTLDACRRLGVRGVGIDNDPDYCAVARERLGIVGS